MAKRPTLLEHFRSFAYVNDIKDFDTALEYFTVFGGTGWELDTSKSVDTLIKEKVLSNYEPIHNGIIRFTHGNALYHMLLSIIALGENHEDAVFKKARVGREKGEEAMDYLEMKSLLRFDSSVEKPLKSSDAKSDKVFFELPFMRFWFATISPYYKSISSKNFSEFEEKWSQLRGNFSILLSNLLVLELIKQTFAEKFMDDPIVSIGSYYDKHIQIEILAIRKSGKMLAGECKYSIKPAKENMLTLLQEKCQKAELNIEDYVLFSKNGFTSQLTQMKNAEMTLLSQSHLSSLLDDLAKDDLLAYKNKKY
ncbi:MAG: ATPase [Sulfurovum sp.]|nr:MAG: ATPase [Sulfurovum sp.]